MNTNTDIHCGTCTVKGDMKACLATPCSVRSSWFSNSQAEQIEALKADAERYRYLRKHVLFGYCSAEGCNSDDVYLTVTGYKDFPKSGETVDMAIDAMKGKS